MSSEKARLIALAVAFLGGLLGWAAWWWTITPLERVLGRVPGPGGALLVGLGIWSVLGLFIVLGLALALPLALLVLRPDRRA